MKFGKKKLEIFKIEFFKIKIKNWILGDLIFD